MYPVRYSKQRIYFITGSFDFPTEVLNIANCVYKTIVLFCRYPDILPKDTLPKDILPKDILPKDILPNGHFADGRFAERTFCRTDILPNGQFAERTTCRK
jgi:hypothetical protein